MASSLQPGMAAFVSYINLYAQQHWVLVPVLTLTLARLMYYRHRRHLDHIRLQQALSRQLIIEFDDSRNHDAVSTKPVINPAEEWIIVAEDGTQAHSLVCYSASKPEGNHVLVLLIPGNPGVPFFYLSLMQELVKKHGLRHEVRCISHTSHFMPWKNIERTFTLQEQLEHKAFYIKQRLYKDPSLRLVVIGHSIGSYFALDIARKFPQHIAKLVLMQPTIMHMAQSRKGKQMMPLFNHYEHGAKLVNVIEYLIPFVLRHWIVCYVVGSKTSKTLRLASLSLVNSSVMRNVLGMAANEMKNVTELDYKLIAKFETKTLFVYSTVDEWVPAEFVQELQVRFPNGQHRIVPQAHAFMMGANGAHDMVAHISPWVADVLDCKIDASATKS